MIQPEALRLADALDYGVYDAQMARVMDKAAAELRRLHAENEQITKYADALNERCIKDAERIGALLEALHSISLAAQDSGSTREGMGLYARAAIAKVEGQQ